MTFTDLIHDDINEKDIGILEFNNCYKYRLSPNNDEGQCRFLNTDIELGNFYEIIHSNWINDFPTDGIIIDNTLKGNQALQHYLFYFRDETFECIAISHCFSIKAANSRPNPTT